MFKNILVAFDGSVASRKALEAAIELAKIFHADLSLVSVEEHLPKFPGDIGEVKEEKQRQNNYFRNLHREARELAKLQGLDLHRIDVFAGPVARSIIQHAKAIKCDLIVVGHTGHSGAWGKLLGSTADQIGDYAHCTVMIVR